MAQATLTIDLGAIVANWQALDAFSGGETAAVVKANGYGLGAAEVGTVLAHAGARTFFVALAEEGAALRQALGDGPEIYVFSGHMPGDAPLIREHQLTPCLNSVDQLLAQVEGLPGAPFAVQLDTGMNRLGIEPADWAAVRDLVVAQRPRLIMSHLSCADERDHAMNAQQLQSFREMTDGIEIRRSLGATGGTLLGPEFHFDMTRPGVGLYGGLPFADALPVVQLDIPIIQIRDLAPGESAGYGNAFVAQRPTRMATISAGYADGLIRAMGPQAALYAGESRVPVAGRVSMDLITVDITDAPEIPASLQLLGPHQTVDMLADWAGTIGYEILTSMGTRYNRRYRVS